MDEVASSETAVLAFKGSGQMDILSFDGPHFDDASIDEREGRVQGLLTGNRQVGVEKLLKHLGGRYEGNLLLDRVG